MTEINPACHQPFCKPSAGDLAQRWYGFSKVSQQQKEVSASPNSRYHYVPFFIVAQYQNNYLKSIKMVWCHLQIMPNTLPALSTISHDYHAWATILPSGRTCRTLHLASEPWRPYCKAYNTPAGCGVRPKRQHSRGCRICCNHQTFLCTSTRRNRSL